MNQTSEITHSSGILLPTFGLMFVSSGIGMLVARIQGHQVSAGWITLSAMTGVLILLWSFRRRFFK